MKNLKYWICKLPIVNRIFNRSLTSDFVKSIKERKEQNSKIVFEAYYKPLAMREVLKRDKYLSPMNSPTVELLATSMMMKDLSDGTLTEFFKFKERG